MYEVTCERHRIAVKYIDGTYDSRSGKIFVIKFRTGFSGKKHFILIMIKILKKYING